MGEKTTIQIRDETWKQLDIRKQRGETFDDVIQGLMGAEVRDAEVEPEVEGFVEAGENEQCAHFIPDRGPCEKGADYLLTITYAGDGSSVPYCEEHANLHGEGVEEE